jgi:cell volume regulation protein A
MKGEVLLVISLLLLTLILLANIFHKVNVPLIMMSLLIGIIFGSDVTGLIYFDDAVLTKNIANIALMFILFTGGFSTKKSNLNSVLTPVSLLATLGVALTAIITALLFYQISGWPFYYALLLGSILSSTDATAVFSILKNKSVQYHVKSVTEMESVLNDPMAIVLTMFVLNLLSGKEFHILKSLLLILWQLGGGVGIGLLIGYLAVLVFNKIRSNEKEFFYVYIIAIVLLSYSLAEMFKASGVISSFFAGFVMGNSIIPYKKGLLAFNNTLSFITNMGLFILLGLLVFPAKFSSIWDKGIIVFIIISFIARPLSVWLLTLFSGLKIKEKIFVSWSGIRGAVPIVLATYPSAAGYDHNHEIFNIVFFTVTLSMLFQGTTLTYLLEKFKLGTKEKDMSSRVMELVTIQDTNYEVIDVFIDETIYEGTCQISELKLPPGTLVIFLTRGKKIVSPSGTTLIKPNDTLTILVEKENIDMIPIEILRSFIVKSFQHHPKKVLNERPKD